MTTTGMERRIAQLQTHCVVETETGIVCIYPVSQREKAAALVLGGTCRRMTRAEVLEMFKDEIKERGRTHPEGVASMSPATLTPSIPRGFIAESPATIARYALDHARNSKRSGWWIVFMDEERRLWEPPRLLRDKPIKAECGRIGSGLTRNVQNALVLRRDQHLGPGYYAVVHFLGDGPRKIGAEDLETVRRWTRLDGPRTNDIELETPEAWISRTAAEWPDAMLFFEDLLCVWADGSFASVRARLQGEPEEART